MNCYWTDEEIKALEKVGSFEEAADIAVGILSRMRESNHDIVQICGPMSTGGLWDLKKNMAVFHRAIEAATKRGLFVFNQLPFQDAIIRICKWKEGQPYRMDILEVFYRKIFESGHIGKTLFLQGWRDSKGATWERQLLTELSIPIEEYPMEWLN